MIRNYLKCAFRSHWRFKGFSFINLVGLASGMSVCLLVFIFVRHEQNYDSLYKKNIYRVCEIKQNEGGASQKKIAQTMFPMAPALKSEVPGIIDFIRIIFLEKMPLQRPNSPAITVNTYQTDASFLRLFGLKLLSGDEASALKEAGSMVLTQSLARRLFGNSNPMGQIVSRRLGDTTYFKVTGILPDIPAQSHLQFDAVYSLITDERPDWMTYWNSEWSFTYLELDEHTDIKALQAKFPAFLQKHMGQADASRYQLFLQPLKEVHLNSDDINRDLLNAQKFDGNYIPLLIAVAFFVLLLGIINYVNLSTARLLTRAKEVGVRKTSGAGRKEIVIQFFSETLLFSLATFLLAVVLVLALLPLLSQLTQRDFHLNSLMQPLWLLIAVGIVLATGFLAGLVPAISMAGIQPAAVLKGKLWTGHRSPLRSALVIIQFTIAIGLSMATLTAFRQLRFIQQYDLGFNKEAVMVVPVSYTNMQTEAALMQRFRQIPGVLGVTGALRRLGSSLEQNEVIFRGSGENRALHCSNMYIDYNYLSFYNISLLAGRSLSPEFGADRNGQSYIINETMARELMTYSSSRDGSLASLIGKGFRHAYEDSFGTIIGITRDFNFNSLHQPIEPLCLSYLHYYYFADLSIRLDIKRTNEILSQMEQAWKDVLPRQQFSYYFLDNYLQQLYKSDTQTGLFIAISTLIAFFVSCLGLVGVAAFTIERRTKEIGIRKVMGATVSNIVFLLSKDFIKLVLISITIAIPLAWWAIVQWMQDFAYRTTISWWLFAAVAMMALLIAILTVSFQSVRAAIANPVKSIRLE